MENATRRQLIIATGFVLFFVIIVLVWYFFYAKPIIAPSLKSTNDPLPTKIFPPRFQFLNWGDDTLSTSTTEVTNPLEKPLVKVWGSPSTGQTFIIDQILKEVNATSSLGTTTVEIKKTVRATSSVLLFVDKMTGYVYGYPLETKKVFQISNTLIPGVYDAYFFDNGSRVIMRYFDQEKNKVVGIIAQVPLITQGSDALPLKRIQYLSSQVISVAVNTAKEEASYVTATENGSAIYSVTKEKDPFLRASSPFREWNLSYGGSVLYVTTRPSAYVEGSTFSLPLFQSEISEKTGLITNPNESGLLLSSMWGKGGLVTFLSDRGNIRVLSVATLATKCGWGRKYFLVCAVPRTIPRPTEGLPDDWFQGRVSFSDDLVLVDKNTGERYSFYNFSEEDGVFDVVGITISETNEFLGFNKKQDSSLWLLNTNLLGDN